MTAPTAAAMCMPWCADKGHHPDSHCVQKDTEVTDVHGSATHIAAYAQHGLREAGVYVGSLMYRPAAARELAAALLNAADAADQALNAFASGVLR